MKDPMVVSAQSWLNKNFDMELELTGHTGTTVVQALITALQYDLEMMPVTGYFGDSTAAAYALRQISLGSYDPADNSSHLVTILQYALFCKGYNPGYNLGSFDSSTLAAVKKVQIDAGLIGSQISEVVTPRVFKAILSTDALVLISGGDPIIRGIQQTINHKYLDYVGIMPCDGFFGAGLAKSLIYALQIEGGMAIGTANGNFGTGTQTIAINNPQSPSKYSSTFVLIAKYALYCNGVRRSGINSFNTSVNGLFSGIYDEAMTAAVINFQKFVAIIEVTGTIGIKEWMSLLVSTGYPKRNVIACDTSTQITDIKAQRLIANDFKIIGRYLTGATSVAPKSLSREELQILFNRGISVFAIYQDEKAYYVANPNEYTTENYYDYEQGLNDAEKACNAAISLGIPYGQYIFFSVDYDFNNAQVASKIIPHFKGINEYIKKHGSKYKIGIYGPRNVCTRVSNVSYAELSFVSDMSTGFSGNLGYELPENWAFDQIREYYQGATDGNFNNDCVAASGRYMGFSSIIPEGIVQADLSVYDIGLNFYKSVVNSLGITVEEDLHFDSKFETDLGAFKVEYEGKLGGTVSINSENEMTKISIENGAFKDSSWTQALDIATGASVEVNAGLTSAGQIEFGENLKWMINDGYFKFGIKITGEGNLEISYVIHKDASVSEGLSMYSEIGVKLISKDTLSQDALDAYSVYEKCIDMTKVVDDFLNYDWTTVVKIALAILVILICGALLYYFGLPILFGILAGVAEQIAYNI